jgi:DNA-binding transcriptional MerR regulator
MPLAPEPRFSISQLARELDLTPRSIRYYEERGLVAPGRTAGGQRFYGKRDRARLKLILRGRRFGYSLEEIAEMIGLTDAELGEAEQIRQSLSHGERKLADIRSRIAELRQLEGELVEVRERLRRRLAEIATEEE